MSCTNCALTIHKYLEQEGLANVKVNFIGGDISFEVAEPAAKTGIQKGIEKLGYHVDTGDALQTAPPKKLFKNHLQRFAFCLVFTLPLLLHMLPGLHIHVLMNPWVQFALTLPVYVVGMDFFGRSAIKSIRQGIPNMNVLVALGATAAFVYSLTGTLGPHPEQYLFYETTATILTLVFLGNWLEDRTVATTQAALQELMVTRKIMANMIAYDDQFQEHIFPVESVHLKVGDLVLIKTGEYVPVDCKILSGEVSVNESILTGESLPVEKKMNDILIGGSIVEQGSVKAYVSAVGDDTVMSHIVQLVKEAQGEKPPVQQLADKISAIFVPLVLGIALLALAGNYFFTSIGFSASLLRSIAILVIACPCAMGLATPAAVAVGMGRAARNGILFKNAKSLELFKDIRQVVFDKTGTLTTGNFRVTKFELAPGAGIDEAAFKQLAYSIEKYSNHPIARSITAEWKTKTSLRWTKTTEVRGLGMQVTDKEGNLYTAGSYKAAAAQTDDAMHNVYILKNEQLLGWIDVADDIRPEAAEVVRWFTSRGIKTILLSGDNMYKCSQVAEALGIDEVLADQTPAQKMERVALYNAQAPVAMIGDGINDAPALAKATIGISLSDASQIALQSAQVILMNHGLKQLPLSLGLGKHTFITIRQNLAWAFLYNIIAIPVAATGLLSPAFGALVMGLNDVVLAVNSVRLRWKKVA